MTVSKITVATAVEAKEYRQIQQGIVLYTEFGTLTEVRDQPGWITLVNDVKWTISMKKVYAGWVRVYQYANKMIGKPIIFETGSSSSSRNFFRDIYEDDEIFPLMANIPKDAGPGAAGALISAELRNVKTRHYLSNAIAEIEDMTAAMQRMSTAERQEADEAIAALDADWHNWTDGTPRSLLIAGQCINKSKHPKKIDISFAFRLGVDVTKRKRINIKVVERIGTGNKVKVKLSDYNDEECIVAVKPSNHPSTLNEWAVATVLNQIDGWQKIETTKYKDVKNRRDPIQYFLDKHKDAVWDCL